MFILLQWTFCFIVDWLFLKVAYMLIKKEKTWMQIYFLNEKNQN